MKRIVYVSLVVMMVIAAKTLRVSAQAGESRPVSGFNSIFLGEALAVHVKIDGTESLKIVTAPGISQYIETVVKDGVLKIKFKDNLKSGEGDTDGPIDIYVTAKSLSSIVKDGSGSIDVEGDVSGNEVNIDLNGSGIIQSSVKSENLRTSIVGSGIIQLSGSANKAKVKIVGPGRINGRNLKVDDASVTITGAGSASFNADKTLSAHIEGAGGVVYSGNATVTKIGDGGTVSKAD